MLLLVLLPACASTNPSAENGKVDIVWNRVDDVHGVCEGLAGRREFFRILGCSRWSAEKGVRTCTIYAPEPRDERDSQRFATLGHELLHCFDGNWHDRWGRMNDAKIREARRSAAAGGSASSTQ